LAIVSHQKNSKNQVFVEDTLWLLSQLRESRLDYVHVSLNNYDRVSRDPQYQDKSIMTYVHEALQGKLPLVGVGGVRTRDDVKTVLQTAELVAVGQQLLYDPTWAVKLAKNADNTMVTAPFEEAVEVTPLSRPLYEFAASRYHSVINS
jgi:NADH:flavin oxidoreductases, Old Yellow Enzyme family